jgi:Polyketide cyclase / dehydrase and lipid transport
VFDIDLPASPTIVWDWVNSAEHQRQWQISANSIDMRHPKGVWGVGTTSHCVHGKVAMVHEVVDSKPFVYFTIRSTLPFGRTESTWELTPGPETEMTHLQIRMRPEQRLRTRLTTRLVGPRMGRMMGRDLPTLLACWPSRTGSGAHQALRQRTAIHPVLSASQSERDQLHVRDAFAGLFEQFPNFGFHTSQTSWPFETPSRSRVPLCSGFAASVAFEALDGVADDDN